MPKPLAAAAGIVASVWLLSWIGPANYGPWTGTGAIAGPVRILQFYATAGAVQSGEKAQLCYSVENARSVRISPLLPGIFPSDRRCIEVVPDHTTHYTIMAVGFDGATAIRSLTLPVTDSQPALEPDISYVASQQRPRIGEAR